MSRVYISVNFILDFQYVLMDVRFCIEEWKVLEWVRCDALNIQTHSTGLWIGVYVRWMDKAAYKIRLLFELPHIQNMCRDRTTIHSHSILTIKAVRACHNTTLFQIVDCIAFDEVEAYAGGWMCGNVCIRGIVGHIQYTNMPVKWEILQICSDWFGAKDYVSLC